nr:MAG TPA: hypothetical protein [Caudoviricetes sp.]
MCITKKSLKNRLFTFQYIISRRSGNRTPISGFGDQYNSIIPTVRLRQRSITCYLLFN